MVGDRQASKNEARYDLFSALLDANNEDDHARLTERELIGEILYSLWKVRPLTFH
jgi:hypothetical protein